VFPFASSEEEEEEEEACVLVPQEVEKE